MSFKLPELPYDPSAMSPILSKETFEYHYGKHHRAYVDKLNQLIDGTDFAQKTLEEIVKSSKDKPPVFNNAAQAWNHTFYWLGLSPRKGMLPGGALKDQIKKDFGSFEDFKNKFSEASVAQFGSGWGWLVWNTSGKLEIVTTSNAGNPMTEGKVPLLTCDVWEHAYYIDYRNARPKYIEQFWEITNWEFADTNFAAKTIANMSLLMRR